MNTQRWQSPDGRLTLDFDRPADGGDEGPVSVVVTFDQDAAAAQALIVSPQQATLVDLRFRSGVQIVGQLWLAYPVVGGVRRLGLLADFRFGTGGAMAHVEGVVANWPLKGEPPAPPVEPPAPEPPAPDLTD